MRMKMRKSTYLKFFERLEENSQFRLEVGNLRNQLNKSSSNSNALGLKKLTKLTVSLLKKDFREMQFNSADFEMYLAAYLTDGKSGIEFLTKLAPKSYGISAHSIRGVSKTDLDLLKKQYPNGVLFVVSPDISKEEVLDYFRRIYKTSSSFMRMMMMGEQKAIRVRSYSQSEKQNRIYLFWLNQKESLSTLNRKSGHNDYDKFAAIARIIPKELGGPMKAEKLRTIIQRVGKRKRL